jgi:hypothetical protein
MNAGLNPSRLKLLHELGSVDLRAKKDRKEVITRLARKTQKGNR